MMKKRSLVLSTNKVIKLTGISIAITPGLEIGEGFTNNILGFLELPAGEKSKTTVGNPHGLTKEEVIEIADYNIRLWMDLKDNVREKGMDDTEIFRRWQL